MTSEIKNKVPDLYNKISFNIPTAYLDEILDFMENTYAIFPIEKEVKEETDVYEDGTPSPYVIVKCRDYATDLCFNNCKVRSIGCAGSRLHGEPKK